MLFLLAVFIFFPVNVFARSMALGSEKFEKSEGETLPVIISESAYDIDGDGKTEKIEILLEKGRRYNDEEPWCGNGEKWEGYFSIQTIKGGIVLSNQSLNSLMLMSTKNLDPLSFLAPEFVLIFKDYNADGQIDFNLGQYAGCNGWYYNLFTIQAEGTVTLLSAEEREYGFFLSNPSDNLNSTDAIHAEGGVIKFSYYDQSRGNVEASYKWNGKQFMLLKEEVEEVLE